MAYILSNKIEFPDTLTSEKSAVFAKHGVGLYINKTAPSWSTTGTGSVFDGAGDWVHAEGNDAGFEAACDADMATLAAAIDPDITHVVIDAETVSWYAMVGPDNEGTTTLAGAWEIARWAYMLQSARDAMPGRKFGIYGFPERNWYELKSDNATLVSDVYARTDTLQDVFDAMDFICPSIYCMFPLGGGVTEAEYQKYAGRMMYNTLRVASAAGGKPVYPTLSVVYWSGETLVTAADWAVFMPALLAATELDWEGNSGSDKAAGYLLWQYQETAADMDHCLRNIRLNSPLLAAQTALV